eukprot:9112611-Pyramimonas_sp.AAC.1
MESIGWCQSCRASVHSCARYGRTRRTHRGGCCTSPCTTCRRSCRTLLNIKMNEIKDHKRNLEADGGLLEWEPGRSR